MDDILWSRERISVEEYLRSSQTTSVVKAIIFMSNSVFFFERLKKMEHLKIPEKNLAKQG